MVKMPINDERLTRIVATSVYNVLCSMT